MFEGISDDVRDLAAALLQKHGLLKKDGGQSGAK